MGIGASFREGHHPTLGKVRTIEWRGEQYIEKEFTLSDQIQVQQFEKGCNLARSFKNRYLFLPKSIETKFLGYCGYGTTLALKFEYFMNTLSGDIMAREVTGIKYSEEELLRVLYIVAASVKDFELRKTRMGNIHSDCILLQQSKDVRVVCRYSWPGESVGVERLLEKSRGCYVSPLELQKLNKKSIFSTAEERGKNEAFGLGMLLLEMGTLKLGDDLYCLNPKLNYLRIDRLRQRIAEFGNRGYSEFLQRVLVNLLEEDQENRPSAGQLYAMLLPFEQEILLERKFEVNRGLMALSVRKYLEQIGLQ